MESLWINGSFKTFWIQKEVRKAGGEVPVKTKKKRRKKEEGTRTKLRKTKEEGSTFGHRRSELDTVALLKACAKKKDLFEGSRIHAEIVNNGLLKKNVYVGGALVHMYAKCGALAEAQQVFDELPGRDVVSWTVLISGYVQYEHGEKAINCFEQMQLGGFSPDAVTFACILKACGTIGAVDRGKAIHAEVARQGLLRKDTVLGTALVDMYAKCGELAKAQEVFDELPVHDVVLWNALITGYAQHGHGNEAINCYELMQLEGLSPSAVTFACILKSCASIGNLTKGQEIHDIISEKGLLVKNNVLGNALVDMYAKCGALAKAQEVFGKLGVQNAVAWTVLIAGYVQQGHNKEAINCFEQMQCGVFFPDAITFACILKACGNIGAARKGQEIHANIVGEGLEVDNVVGTALVDFYGNCGAFAEAQEVFDELPVQDLVSWNVLIAGYVQQGDDKKAINCFERMQLAGHSPDAVTFACVLKACGNTEASVKGQGIHAEIVRQGLLEKDDVVGIALMDMYAKCGAVAKAREVFDDLPTRNVVIWTVLIAGYIQHGHDEKAINCFQKMKQDGICPNAITFACILKAYGKVGGIKTGQEIHAEIVSQGLLKQNTVVATALVAMYAECGALVTAQQVFDELPVRDAVTWTALIAGYAQQGHGEKAIDCFESMQHEGISPNAVTFSCLLKACGSIGAAHKGQKLHATISAKDLFAKDNVISTALVDMYAKCGALAKAQEVFDELPAWDLISWTALIAGYSRLGKAALVFSLFDKMIGEGKEPDLITFNILLNTCSHSGLLEKGLLYLEMMITRYGIIPALDHYTCIIDLLGRAGLIDKAVAVIKDMPFSATLTVWHNMLGACLKWGNVKLGRLAFVHAIKLDEKDNAAYVGMIDIYAAAYLRKNL